MRIIAGSLKGRRLVPPRWDGLRPTSDRLRETLFNVLGDRPVDARVLDAFAGTGALGIEALSRGAAHVVLVDRDVRASTLIEQNLARCGVASAATVVCDTFPAAVRSPLLETPFDLVLLDPPYDAQGIDVILSALAGCVNSEGLLVCERTRRRAPVETERLELLRTVSAGDSALDFYHGATGVRAVDPTSRE